MNYRSNPDTEGHVYLYNNHGTPQTFVEIILQQVFELTREESKELTMEIHHSGKGLVKTYPSFYQAKEAVDTATDADEKIRQRISSDPVMSSKLAALGVDIWAEPLVFEAVEVEPLDPGILWDF